MSKISSCRSQSASSRNRSSTLINTNHHQAAQLCLSRPQATVNPIGPDIYLPDFILACSVPALVFFHPDLLQTQHRAHRQAFRLRPTRTFSASPITRQDTPFMYSQVSAASSDFVFLTYGGTSAERKVTGAPVLALLSGSALSPAPHRSAARVRVDSLCVPHRPCHPLYGALNAAPAVPVTPLPRPEN